MASGNDQIETSTPHVPELQGGQSSKFTLASFVLIAPVIMPVNHAE